MWQLLRQLSAECHLRRRPVTVVEPVIVDSHYLTVNDPTTVRRVLSVLNEQQQTPTSPTTHRPGSTAVGHSGAGIVLRTRRRADDSDDSRQSVVLFDKQQMDRYIRRVSHRPTFRRLKSTPSTTSPSRHDTPKSRLDISTPA